MITSKVKNATIPYQHTHSPFPQDNKGLFGGKLEGNGQGITLILPRFLPLFSSQSSIILAQSFPSLEGYVYSKITALGGLSLMKSYENTYPKSHCCAKEKRHLKRRWTSISSVKPRLQSLKSLKTALPATGSNNPTESAH